MGVGAALVAHVEATEVGEPRHGALHDPADTAQARAALDADARDAVHAAPAAQIGMAARDIVGFVGLHLLRALARTTARTLDGGMPSRRAAK